MDGDGKWNEPNWMGMQTGKWSVNSNYDPKQCCAWWTIEIYPLQLFGGMQILSMQLQTLWTPLYSCKLWQSKQQSTGQYWGGGWQLKLNALKLILWTKVYVHYMIVDSWRSWIQFHNDSIGHHWPIESLWNWIHDRVTFSKVVLMCSLPPKTWG